MPHFLLIQVAAFFYYVTQLVVVAILKLLEYSYPWYYPVNSIGIKFESFKYSVSNATTELNSVSEFRLSGLGRRFK